MKLQVWLGILALAFPFLVFVSGARLMNVMSGRARAEEPLNVRWSGYSAEDARRTWSALTEDEKRTERAFLRLDLTFPLLYGGAFALALSGFAARFGSPVRIEWLLAIVLVAMLADWTENTIQLNQLGTAIANPSASLDAQAIGIASLATQIKLYACTLVAATTVLLWLRSVAIAVGWASTRPS